MSYYFRKTLPHLLHFHIIGAGISFFYFSYQYAQDNGFLSWLFFGEFKPALKAAVWEVFLVIALLQNPAQDPVVNSSSQNFWWQTEYSILIKRVTDAADSSLSTSYRTGPAGRGRVRLQLTKTQDDGLVLTIELPREAISSIDEKTGESIPSETTLQTTIRDHNLDGLPDDFKIEPAGKPIYAEDFTEDGFIKYRDSNDHQAILIQWSIAIGYSTNHFIHGIDSAMPRK